MKNLFILNDYQSSKTNGIGSYINQLTACFKNEEHIILTIIDLYADTTQFCITQIGGINRIQFPHFKFGASLEKISRIINTFFKIYIPDNEDNIFIFNHSPNSELMKRIRTSHPKSKQVYVIHNMSWTTIFNGDEIEFKKSFKKNQESDTRITFMFKEEISMCMEADRIVCLCHDTYQLLKTHYQISEKKLVCISNGLQMIGKMKYNKILIRHSLQLSNKEIILLYVGRINKSKGAFELIKAFKSLASRLSNCRLVMIGAAQNWNEVFSLIYPFSSRFIFTGVLNRDDINKWYHIADIGIIPSYTEQCSYVGLEMLSYGLPIVCSDGFGVKNVFDEFYGLTAQIGDRKSPDIYIKNLADKIKELILSESLRKHYSDISKKVFKEKYTFLKMKEKYLSLIEELVPKTTNKHPS